MADETHIPTNPHVLAGKAIVRGARISVEMVIDLLAAGWTPKQIYENDPRLQPGDVEACLRSASSLLHDERLYPLKTA
ncbi:MAG: DUF433 domain-containing protein [Bryobacterales bacterium]|nr:DUF433 domain-containing protein [Bryobacterales bacterium]